MDLDRIKHDLQLEMVHESHPFFEGCEEGENMYSFKCKMKIY